MMPKKFWTFIFAIILISCFRFSSGNAATAVDHNSTELFYTANQFYDNGEYQKAALQYLELLNRHYQTSELYFNLGNAYFRNGELGKSIYFFRQALQINPANGNAQFNLNYAREKTLDRIQSPASATHSLEKLASALPFSSKVLIYLAVTSVSLFFLLWAISLHRPKAPLIWARNFTFASWPLIGLLLFLHFNAQKDLGVVVSKSAVVKSAIGKDGITLFVLHEGTEFTVEKMKILSPEETWLLIVLYDGKRGWVNLKNVIVKLREFSDLLRQQQNPPS